MGKRSSETGQMEKGAYEALDRRDSEPPKGPFAKADEETLKKRRFAKPVQRSPMLVPGGMATPKTAGGSTPGGNPFGGVKLTTDDSQPTPGNPFTSVKLASGTKPSFSFGESSNASAGFGFGTTVSSSSVSFKGTTTTPSSGTDISGGVPTNSAITSQDKDKQLARLLEASRAKHRHEESTGNTSHLLRDLQNFCAYYTAIMVESSPAPAPPSSESPPPAASAKPFVATTASKDAPKQFGGDFSFGADKPKSPKTNFSFQASTPSAPPPAAAPTSAPPPAADEDAFPVENSEPVGRSQDPDWKMVYEVEKSKYYLNVEGKWKAFATGPLHVEQFKSNPTKRRILIRDSTGKVQLNVTIGKGVVFSGKAKENKFFVQFIAVVKGTEPEPIMLAFPRKDYEPSLALLKKMAE